MILCGELSSTPQSYSVNGKSTYWAQGHSQRALLDSVGNGLGRESTRDYKDITLTYQGVHESTSLMK